MSPNIPDKYYRRVPYNIHELDEHRGVKLHGPFPADSPLARFYKQDEAALIELVYQNVLHEKGQREVNQAFKQALSHKKKKRMAIAEEFCKVHGVPVDNVAELTPEAKNVVRVPNHLRMPTFVMLCIFYLIGLICLIFYCHLRPEYFAAKINQPEPVPMVFGIWAYFGFFFSAYGILSLIYGLWVQQYSIREVWSQPAGMGAIVTLVFGAVGLIAVGAVWWFSVSIVPWVIFVGIPQALRVLNGGK